MSIKKRKEAGDREKVKHQSRKLIGKDNKKDRVFNPEERHV